MSDNHLAILVHQQAEKYGRRTALKYRDIKRKKWLPISWLKFSEYVNKTAWAMAELGVEEQDKIGIYSQNMAQYLFTDFGMYANRAISVPIYATSSPAQIEYIINDAHIKLLFVGEQFQYNNAYKVQQHSSVLKRLIVFDSSVKFHPEDTTSIYYDDFILTGQNSEAEVIVNVRTKSRQDADIATIIYTSGTTGEPKGVVLPHSCFDEVFSIHDIRLPDVSDKDVSMCFLPLAHVFEKAWSYYCVYKGMTIIVNQDAKMIQKSIKQTRPTVMCSVPRFWEKVYSGVYEKIESSRGLMKWIYRDAIKVGKKYNLDYKNDGQKISSATKIKFRLYDKTVYTVLKMVIGINKGQLFPCAGAALSASICEFLISVNIPIIVGYGLTETTATVSVFPVSNYKTDSIGCIMPHLEVKLDEQNNEILVKGRTVMREYYNKPEETAKAFTEDGFFRTGDAGRFEDGTLYLTERIKDLYKTSNGKYIAPQAIETKLGEDKYVDMIIAIADERKYVSALVVPNYAALKEYADENRISYTNEKQLLTHVDILRMLDARFEILQAYFTPFEKVKKFALLAEPFTIETGELTDTLKLRRKIIVDKHKEIIDKMYQE